MSENDFENDSNVAVTEPPPADKSEKPARKPRKTKAAKEAEEAAAAAASEEAAAGGESDLVEPTPEPAAPPAPLLSDNGSNGNGAEVLEARPKRGDQTQAAETLDIR